MLLFVTHTPLTLLYRRTPVWEQTMSEFTAPGAELDPAAPYSRVAGIANISADLCAGFVTAAT
ncbi:hypothetical protein [Nocardia sp. NPDC057455]|uniref:hypothetical protein n=1 Tax=Nocardia sp. NPDC057455 TaxID=3346138 RepID=UPI00366E7676